MNIALFREEESCFIVNISDASTIRREPFTLASGDTLQVGDMFTEIHSTGSAGNQPVKLTKPWVQRYQGLLKIESDDDGRSINWQGRDLVLFDSINIEEKIEGFISFKKSNETLGIKDHYYIAYLRFCDSMLFHTRGGSASSVCKCTGITRYKDKLQSVA